MMKRGRGGGGGEAEENVFWVTMTDLLLGLAVVFMTLFVLAMTGFSQNKLEQQQAQGDVAKELSSKLQKADIEAVVDKVTGQVKISDLELFEVNSYELSPKGKIYLNKFIPVYINTIYSNSKINDKILNIIVQGHTDSQSFAGLNTKDEQFIRNMQLSTMRANSVAEYMFKTGYNKKYSPKLRKMLVVEGKSFTEPVLVDGKEDYAKSRRVELKLVIKDSNIQDLFLGDKIKHDNLQ